MNIFDELPICSIHNLKTEYRNPDQCNSAKQWICRQCADQLYGLIHISQVQQSNQAILMQFELLCNQNSQILNQIKLSLIQFRENFIKNTQFIIDDINEIIPITDNYLQQIKKTIMIKEDLRVLHQQYLEKYRYFKNRTIKLFETIQFDNNISKLLESLNMIHVYDLNLENKSQKINIEQLQLSVIDLDLQCQSLKQQYDFCNVLALNKDGNILITGCGKIIKVFELNGNQLLEIQRISSHYYEISCLQFMKKNNQFISGCSECIKIWLQTNTYQWIEIKKLNCNFKGFINCLRLNLDEDQIILGTSKNITKGSIIIWKFNSDKQQWILNQEVQCLSCVKSLSFNNSNILIISQNNSIQVYEVVQNYQWHNIQQINTQYDGDNLGFIKDNEFIFQPHQGEYLKYYKKFNSQFINIYNIKVNNNTDNYSYFPIQFIESRNLILVKHSNHINILIKDTNGQFHSQQYIEYQSQTIFGCVSDDGQFLISWDGQSKEYQIRKFNYLQ